MVGNTCLPNPFYGRFRLDLEIEISIASIRYPVCPCFAPKGQPTAILRIFWAFLAVYIIRINVYNLVNVAAIDIKMGVKHVHPV